jgi:hypothetical protein
MTPEKYSPFDKGDVVSYNGHDGVINFVCERYVTITTRYGETKDRDTNLVVFTEHWNDIQSTCK